MYHIKITKLEPNPAIKEWFEETKEARKYEEKRSMSYGMRNDSDVPRPPDSMIEKKVLETVVSDEEFQAIKKACMEKM
ncbi:MAG: hypothetical protein IPL32_19030 [Chloracidobacterium sp.]|nr:hypothetical protein [Chloracidobacterium sp.]